MKLYKLSIQLSPTKYLQAHIKGETRAKKLAVTLLRRNKTNSYYNIVISPVFGDTFWFTEKGKVVEFISSARVLSDDFWMLDTEEEDYGDN